MCVFPSILLTYELIASTVTSELLFEQYSIPSLTYCVDGIMSFYHNNFASPFSSSGLVLSFNTASTSIIPVLGGKGILSHAKRFVPRVYSIGGINTCHPTESRGADPSLQSTSSNSFS